MASLIEDLIRGTADATAQMADDNIKLNRQKELMNQQMENQKSLADYNAEISQKLDQAKQELAERMRRSRASDIQAEVGRMADQQIGQQYKTADESADTIGEDYGNEVRRANGFINQAQQEARKNFTPTGNDLLRASVNLGYENPYKLAALESAEDRQSIKTDAYLQVQSAKRDLDLAKLQVQSAKNEGEHQAAMARVATLQASLEAKMSNMGGSAQERNTNIINSANHTITTLGEKPRDPVAAKTWQEQYDAATELRKMAMDELRQKKSGASGDATPSAEPKAVALPPSALSQLKEKVQTTFANGQVWTLKNGKPVQVK